MQVAPFGPVGAAEFAALLDRLGPFEPAPALAVGVSGGADSLALVLLAAAWVEARRGTLLAVTIDHALRPDSGAEAAQVGRWLAARGIAHTVLRWDGDKPATGIQQAARQARHALLEAACRHRAILHLLLAHHQDDQAETVLLRREGGSGADGLAGMAAIRETAGMRVLRPLLPLAKARLVATCQAAGQAWIEDPSNQRFARGRLRQAAATDAGPLAAEAAMAGERRAAAEAATAAFLAAAATCHPEGFVELDAAALAAAPDDLAGRALMRCLATIGGAAWPPAAGPVRRLLERLRAPAASSSAAWTLAGCRVWRRRTAILIAREEARVTDRRALSAGLPAHWDGRFRVVPAPPGEHGAAGDRLLTVAKLGSEGWRQLVAARPDLDRDALPGPVRRCLPALWQDGVVLCVPHLSYVSALAPGLGCQATFQPARPLAGAAFSVVYAPAVII